MNKHSLVISRYWHRPKIDIYLMREGIAIQMSVDDFVRAVAAEMGPQPFVFRKETFYRRTLAAAVSVLEKVKQATSAA